MTPDTEDQSGWLDELADSIITMIGNPDYHQQGSIKIIKTMVSQHEAGVVRANSAKELQDVLTGFTLGASTNKDFLHVIQPMLDSLKHRIAELSAEPKDTQPCKKHGKYTCSACPPEGDSEKGKTE